MFASSLTHNTCIILYISECTCTCTSTEGYSNSEQDADSAETLTFGDSECGSAIYFSDNEQNPCKSVDLEESSLASTGYASDQSSLYGLTVPDDVQYATDGELILGSNIGNIEDIEDTSSCASSDGYAADESFITKDGENMVIRSAFN